MTFRGRTFAGSLLGAVALAATLVCVAPQPAAAAYTWDVGASMAFTGSQSNLDVVTVRGNNVLRLKRQIVWNLKPTNLFDPRTAQRLANGNTVVADGNNAVVTEYSRSGTVVWSYGKVDDPKFVRPWSAERLANGNTLICDRNGFRVIEVTPAKKIVWQYGTGSPTTGPGQLADPFSARRLANGNTLICDNKDAYRVIEVKSSDYAPSKPNLGYTSASIVWRFGTGVSGTAPGEIASPRQAERLANGNTLIADEWGERVIEVDHGGAVVWSFGVPGESGLDDRHLHAPCAMTRLADGRTLIIDKDNHRLLWVNPDGTIDSSFGLGSATPEDGAMVQARTAQVTSSGTVVIADNSLRHVFEIGYVPSGRYETPDLDLGMPGTKKWLLSMTTVAERPTATSIAISYSLDGGSWKPLGSKATATFPTTASCRFARFRFDLASKYADHSPSFRSAQAAYDLTQPEPKPSSSGNTTPTAPGTSGTGTGGTGTSANSSAGLRRYTWGWGSASGSGVTGAGSSASSTGSGGNDMGSPSLGDLSLAKSTGSPAGGQLTGFLLKEVSAGPAEGGSGGTASAGSSGPTDGGAAAPDRDVVAASEKLGARFAVLLVLALAYVAGTASGTLKRTFASIAKSTRSLVPWLEG